MFNPFEGVLTYMRAFRRHLGRRLYVVFLLTMAAALTEGLGIALMVPLLTTLEVGGSSSSDTPTALRWLLESLGLTGSVGGILFLIGLVFVIKGVIHFAHKAYGGVLQAQLLRELKARLFEAYSHMAYPYYVSRDTGHFVNVINVQVNGFYASFVSYKLFLTQAIQASAYLGVALWLAWRFGLMAIGVGGILLVVFKRLNGYVKQLSRQTSLENGVLNKLLVQALQGYKYLASTNKMERLRGGVLSSVGRMTGYRVRQEMWSAFTASLSEPLSVFFIIGIVLVQVLVLNQPLAPMLVAILLFHRGMQAMLGIQNAWQTTLNTIGSVEMVEDELAVLSRHREASGPLDIAPLQEGVTFREVCFAYQAEHGDVLQDVSLHIPARSTVALVGESGSGKSTLVDLLTLLLKPRMGEVLIDGVPGAQAELASWRSQIGYVSQETVVFDDTIAANIALEDVDPDLHPEAFERVREAARQAHIAHFIETLPEGYLTQVGDRGVRLSGGQRQRLFIARELFKEPKLLILDEATSALDTDSERAIQESVDELRGRMTVVIIAHRLSTIRNVDHVYVLDRGRVLEAGTYEELRHRTGSRFKAMVELQTL